MCGAYARILFGLAALTLGCNRGAAPPPKPAAVATTPAAATVPAEAVEEPVADALVDESTAANVAADVAPQPAPSASDEKPADSDDVKPADRGRPERVALLTPGGPLLVDVWLTVDGRPHGAAFAERVKVVLDAADTNNDGRATWKELSENKDYLAGVQPNGPPIGARQMKMLIERFDANGDGHIQPDEAASWLGRDVGVTPSAFALRSSRSYSPNPRATSRVWQLLDSDRDGELSIDETDRAPEKFMLLDGDDDRIITPAELASLREQLEAERNREMGLSREASRYAALHLEPDFDVDRLEYLLSDLYSPRQTLGPESFSELAALYEPIDVNSDGWLEQLELADFATVDPHLEIAVTFDRTDSPQETAATLDIRHQVPEISVVARPSRDRVVLRLGATLLIVSAHDLAPLQPADQYVDPSQIRLMVHDQYDALFEELDMNSDGRLGEREITTMADRLRTRDTDGDGRLANHELPYSMIVAFLRGERLNEQSYYLPAAVTKQTTMAAAPEWFRHADFNDDGDISRREFLGTREHFTQLDANQDSYIDAAEAAALQTE